MTEYQNGRTARPRSRPSSLCTRCGNERPDSRDVSPGRGTWADKGRGLSLEVDGREGRRRHSSSETKTGIQRSSPIHCYIVPIANGQSSSRSTTYRESFRLPPVHQGMPRRVTSAPSSPISASPMSLPSSSHHTSNRQPQLQSGGNTLLSSMSSRLNSRDGNFGRSNTTYRDHFTWLS